MVNAPGLDLPAVKADGHCGNCGMAELACLCFAQPKVMSAWAEWIRSIAVRARARRRWGDRVA